MGAVPALPTTTKGIRTRTTVLDAGRTIFGRDGYVAARMSDVAAEAGLSNGGLYRYFDNKPDLFAALIADIHEELFVASGHTKAALAEDPRAALEEANRGYIAHYAENRDVMRALIEAAAVEERFRTIWWDMRRRHVERFTAVMKSAYGSAKIGGVDVRTAADAMACMVEQCCYVWFAHAEISEHRTTVNQATKICTHAWYATFFDGR